MREKQNRNAKSGKSEMRNGKWKKRKAKWEMRNGKTEMRNGQKSGSEMKYLAPKMGQFLIA